MYEVLFKWFVSPVCLLATVVGKLVLTPTRPLSYFQQICCMSPTGQHNPMFGCTLITFSFPTVPAGGPVQSSSPPFPPPPSPPSPPPPSSFTTTFGISVPAPPSRVPLSLIGSSVLAYEYRVSRKQLCTCALFSVCIYSPRKCPFRVSAHPLFDDPMCPFRVSAHPLFDDPPRHRCLMVRSLLTPARLLPARTA